MTQKAVADALGWSPSKLLRIEQGDVRVSQTDLVALLTHYGITDSSRVETLKEVAKIARRNTFIYKYRDVMPPKFFQYLELETSAEVIRQFEPSLIPGVLQTEDYANVVLRTYVEPDTPEETVLRRIAARLERKQRFIQQDGPQLFVIVDEAALRRMVGAESGDDTIMIEQLAHLKEMNELPNITIQVLPFSIGAHPGMTGPFVILDFLDPNDENVVYLETRGDAILREDDVTTGQYIDLFQQMERERATKPAEFPEFIDLTIRKIKAERAMDLENPGST